MLYVDLVSCGDLADTIAGLNAERPIDRASTPPMMLDFSLIDFFSVIISPFVNLILRRCRGVQHVYIVARPTPFLQCRIYGRGGGYRQLRRNLCKKYSQRKQKSVICKRIYCLIIQAQFCSRRCAMRCVMSDAFHLIAVARITSLKMRRGPTNRRV